ncbi:MAG: superoxide dismutase family protein [Burkholderiaceae bacterium]|jgi:Cu-Zn family superoxide dismutase|nr:superoxide dismutase family protein [Burkholderiaceae bacterium]
MYPSRAVLPLVAAAAAALLSACVIAPSKPKPLEAVVELHEVQPPEPGASAPITGELRFKQWKDEVVINGQVENLPLRAPQLLRGNALHIHETSDCSGPGAANAGGIFNPLHRLHSWAGAGGMMGDLPMLMPDAHGVAVLKDYLSPQVKLDGPYSVIGKAIVIHRDVDDWAIQPDGRAGPGIACGVIRAVKPGEK